MFVFFDFGDENNSILSISQDGYTVQGKQEIIKFATQIGILEEQHISAHMIFTSSSFCNLIVLSFVTLLLLLGNAIAE